MNGLPTAQVFSMIFWEDHNPLLQLLLYTGFISLIWAVILWLNLEVYCAIIIPLYVGQSHYIWKSWKHWLSECESKRFIKARTSTATIKCKCSLDESSSSRKWYFSWLKMRPTNPFECSKNHAHNDKWSIPFLCHNEKNPKRNFKTLCMTFVHIILILISSY